MKRVLGTLVALTLTLSAVHAGTIMFGGNGGHLDPNGGPLSINNGWLVYGRSDDWSRQSDWASDGSVQVERPGIYSQRRSVRHRAQ